jgi:hypothetical protein
MLFEGLAGLEALFHASTRVVRLFDLLDAGIREHERNARLRLATLSLAGSTRTSMSRVARTMP